MKTIEVSEETYEKIKEQLTEQERADLSNLDQLIGNAYFFRTVTYHLVGKVVSVVGMIVQLEGASWIADSGRFMDCIKNGKTNEVEPVGTAYLNLNTVTDFFPPGTTLCQRSKNNEYRNFGNWEQERELELEQEREQELEQEREQEREQEQEQELELEMEREQGQEREREQLKPLDK